MHTKYYGLFAVLSAIYIISIFVFKSDPLVLAHYNISDMQLKLVSLALFIPIVLIWFSGFVGAVNLKKYAHKIRGTKDGRGIALLASGVMVLAISVVINGLAGRIIDYAVQEKAISQHISILFHAQFFAFASLVAFIIIFMGARRLVHSINSEVKQNHVVATILLLILFSIPYVTAIYLDPSRGFGRIVGYKSIFVMPDWAIIFAVIVPYVTAWAFSLFAIVYLYTYSKNVKGIFYRKSMKHIALGFFIVLISTIIVQLLNTASMVLESWGLSSVLLLLYILLVIIGLGFIYIARGAKGLAKIEDVGT